MARGWESKAVEDQMAAQEERRSKKRTSTPAADEREAISRRIGLQLARTKARRDLERATDPRHRAMLERAISDLDAQIS